MPLLQGYPNDPPGVKRRRQELAAALRELKEVRLEGRSARPGEKLTGEVHAEQEAGKAKERLNRLIQALKSKGRGD